MLETLPRGRLYAGSAHSPGMYRLRLGLAMVAAEIFDRDQRERQPKGIHVTK